MPRISNYLSEVYSEELHPFSEAEYDEVMSEGDVENFYVKDGKVYHKPEPPSQGKIKGIEI